jgi:hypothetical protein
MLIGHIGSTSSVELIKTSGRFPTLRLSYSAEHPVINAFSAAFSSAPPASNEPHVSHIPLSTLLENALPSLYASSHGDIGGRAKPWTASDMSEFPPGAMPLSADQVKPKAGFDRREAFARPARLQWGALLGEKDAALDARFALVDGLMRDGIAFVTELPTDKTGNSVDANQEDSPSLARFAEMVSEIDICCLYRAHTSNYSSERFDIPSMARCGMFDHLEHRLEILPIPI